MTATGIVIFGPSGAGKTALGALVASRLGFPFFDTDPFIWRQDTLRPFTVMYPRAEKIARLQAALSGTEHFVVAGSMHSFHEAFDPFFLLAVHLTADVQLRLDRVRARELQQFGARILPGGDMYADHQRFLQYVADYDTGSDGTTLKSHLTWISALSCPVLSLRGEAPLAQNAETVVRAYQKQATGR